MTAATAPANVQVTPVRRASPSTRPPLGVAVAMAVVALLVVAAFFPALLTPYDPLQGQAADSLQPPSPRHWMGTDQIGRDIFSRVIAGARYSLSLGFGAAAVSTVGGIIVGTIAGSLRGFAGHVAARTLDVFLAFPEVLLALITIAVVGPGQISVILAVGLGSIPGSARLVRSQVLRVRHEDFVRHATELGLSRAQVLFRHVTPNSLGPALVTAVLHVGTAIIFGAALSFLGMGAVPPTPEWGLMLSQGRQYLSLAPWVGVFPGLFITITVISVTVTGRWLQQRFVNRRESL